MPKGRINKIVKRKEKTTNQKIDTNETLQEIIDKLDRNSGDVKFENKEKIFKNLNINDNDIRSFKLKKRLQEKLKK